MSSLSAMDKRVLEKLFDMGGGYVLNFSNRTFEEFFVDVVEVDIYNPKYENGSGSKANRLRAFWTLEPDYLVGRLLTGLVEVAEVDFKPDPDLLSKAKQIAARLEGAAAVEDLSALSPNTSEKDFEKLARSVHDAISAGEPEAGLDRLHTFVTWYVGALAQKEGIEVTEDKPLHSVFGELIKALKARGAIETDMAERILKSTISTFESFNHVRNNRSFAHPNPLLSFDEALLIFRNVASSIRFLRAAAAK